MKSKTNIKVILSSIAITAVTAFVIGYSPIVAQNAQELKTTTVQQATSKAVVKTTPLEIVANPSCFLGKHVKFDASFDKFSALGLDYKPALKSSQDYIGILIKRDDVTDHTVPLAEMKLFLKRSEAEKFVDIDSGDKVKIEGIVFSNALGDPWINIDSFVTEQKNDKKAKK